MMAQNENVPEWHGTVLDSEQPKKQSKLGLPPGLAHSYGWDLI